MSAQSKVQWYAILLALFFLWPSACAGIRFGSQEKSTPPLAVPDDGRLAAADSAQHLASAQAPPEPKYFIHTVQGAGETFAAMARWYTGRGDNWVPLARANPDIDPKHHPHRECVGGSMCSTCKLCIACEGCTCAATVVVG